MPGYGVSYAALIRKTPPKVHGEEAIQNPMMASTALLTMTQTYRLATLWVDKSRVMC